MVRMGIIFRYVFLIWAVGVSSIFGLQVPEFVDYSALNGASLSESLEENSFIGTIVGRDPDGTPVEYFIFGEGATFFEIGRTTGRVTLKKLLDYDNRNDPEISLVLRLVDGNNQVEEQSTKVFVDDVNDLKPVFADRALFKEISEDKDPGLKVAFVSVSDQDTTNALLTMRCVGDTPNFADACEKFGLETTNDQISNVYWRGNLVLKQKLDFETRKAYAIKLEASDGTNKDTVEVHVEVLDINDTPPRFLVFSDVTIDEELPNGTVITSVRAVDGDTDTPRQIRYSLIGANNDSFAIDAVRGEISPSVRLDFDESGAGTLVFDLTVRATEVISINPEVLGNDATTTVTTVIAVNVQDIDDNAPQFDKNPYTVTIREDIENRANIPGLQMTVTDKDSTPFDSFDLLILDFEDIFDIIPRSDAKSSSATLFVKNNDLIDYESGTLQYTIRVVARENAVIPPLSGATTIIINVEDVNDEAPVFDMPIYQTDVYENIEVNSPVIDIDATDRERGAFGTAGIRYSLFGNQFNHFGINELTGVISTRACGSGPRHGQFPCIDFERRKSYLLTVSATDDNGNGQTRSVQVRITVLDVNDNQPQLDASYVAYIYEGQTITVNPLIVVGQDPDTVGGPLTYTLTGNPGPFQVTAEGNMSARVGNITATRPVLYSDAQDSATGEVNFQIVVADANKQRSAPVTIIIIDINNNAPQFLQPQYEYTISENTTGRVFIQKIAATDLDAGTTGNGQLEFDITRGGEGKFTVENEVAGSTYYADIYTTDDATFDYETQDEYKMVLVARDQGTPTSLTGTALLTVFITDINNNAPRIDPPSTSITVSENEQIDRSVHRIQATDPDNNFELRYYFQAIRAQNPFGQEVDNNVVDYESMFRINERSGEILVNSALNRDLTSFIAYRLNVVDINGTPFQTGTGALFITILEYNDQAPQFDRELYDILIDEELNRNYFVQNLRCTDADDKIAGYSITQTIPSFPNYFALVDNSGGMIVNDRIDYERIQYIELQGRCEDSGNPRLSNTTRIRVTVRNLNDNAPEFERPLYQANLPEKTNRGIFVVQVSASDIDLEDFGVIRYQLSDPVSSPFEIDPINGSIYVVNETVFDRESSASFSFQVLAYDSPNTPAVRSITQVPVYVNILDINDNCPIFSDSTYESSIPESAPSGTDILDIIANDLDTGINGAINFKITQGSGNPPIAESVFNINSRSGRIRTNDNLKQKSGDYFFNVTATDMNGRSPIPPACATQVPVHIIVTKSENNPPRFVRPPRSDFVISVLESQYEGMLVYNAKAVDTDPGLLGLVDYFFLEGNNLVSRTAEFRINRITGVIRAEIEYDREQVDSYVLTLMAKDKGIPAASSRTILRVLILDVNDNDPVFPMRDGVVVPLVMPRFPVREDVQLGTNGLFLGNCNATDLDSDHANNRIFYELYAPMDIVRETILVERETCYVYLIKSVHFEQTPTLQFNIIAFNERNDDTVRRQKRSVNPSILPVVVNIANVNDHPPVFSKSSYMACTYRNTPFVQNILFVQVTDFDAASAIQYSLEGTTAFIIDSSGSIRSDGSSFLTSNTVHTFKVRANDGTFSATADVTIFVMGTSNQVRVKQNRPRLDAFASQAAARIAAETSGIDFACAVSDDFITDEGVPSDLTSELVVSAVRINTATQPNTYHIYSSGELLNILSDGTGEYVNVQEEDDDEFSFSEDSVIAIFIICILLIFIALLLFCLACYCIRSKKKRKTKKIKAQRHTVVQVTEEQGPSFQNPVYHNQGYNPDEPEYASVKKSKPIAPVVIAAPENLEPLEQQPTDLIPEPQEASEPEPYIETIILPEEDPDTPPEIPEPEYEDRIETVVVDDSPVQASQPPIDEDVIEVEFGEEPPVLPPHLDDSIEVEIVDDLPLPTPPPEENEFMIETSVQDS